MHAHRRLYLGLSVRFLTTMTIDIRWDSISHGGADLTAAFPRMPKSTAYDYAKRVA
jgi:hypothetical protein